MLDSSNLYKKFLLLCSIGLFVSSCAIHSGLTLNTNNSVTNVVLQSSNYKIIQKVQGQASGIYVLGIIGGAFRPLLENARSEMLKNANLLGHSRAIINETVEVNNKFFVVFGIKTVTVSAYVIEFTGNNSMQQQSTQQINSQPQQQTNDNFSAAQLQEQEQLPVFFEQKPTAPNGYLNYNEYKNNTPSLYLDFKLERRYKSTYNYDIFNIDKNVKEKLWGICVNGVDYINRGYYNKIEGKGYYSYFIIEDAFGVCFPYIILPTGKIRNLKPELLLELCADNANIIKEIKETKLKKSDFSKMFEILKKYNLTKE